MQTPEEEIIKAEISSPLQQIQMWKTKNPTTDMVLNWTTIPSRDGVILYPTNSPLCYFVGDPT